ncbi:MAG TPA: GT-D fold domain-containing glycosyltransferase [Mycolicibacterium fallax]|nr:GT-D fold domain-containing glycosyltransferase [Mycolicibacterium fallax]
MYPLVKGEFDTVRRLLKGASIARFGDGELKILEGAGYSREVANGRLTSEMRMVAAMPNEGCLIAIPTMDPAGPKHQNWLRHEQRFCKYFERSDGCRYYSAFITRPDSAADNLESPEYFALISKLWAGRDRVVVLSEPSSKLLTCARAMATSVVHIECPSRAAYSVIDDLEAAVVAAEPSIALLSCGPTATCLANRLAGRGIQGVDLGSIGGLLVRWMPKFKNQETAKCD